MQSIGWYINRLRTMTPREVVWRVGDAARDAIDRGRFAAGLYPTAAQLAPTRAHVPRVRVTPVPVGAWVHDSTPPYGHWRDALVKRADELLAHRFTFFNLVAKDFGTPVDWNRDHESGQKTPLTFAPAIDYRDRSLAGDAKVVWEPSRHQHLVVLARAYRATGNEAYAHEVVAQILSWLDQSPFGRGMNWRSPLELAIRAINWVWALDLIHESGAAAAAWDRIRHALYLHLWEITRKYSRGSSANNHLIGEAAGVFVTTAYVPDLPNAAAWHAASREVLEREIGLQTYSDGGGREQATGYQLFVIQFYLAAGVVARARGGDFSPEYWSTLERMLDFISALVEGGPLPMIGDADDGYVLDLGEAPGDSRGLLAAGADLFRRTDFAATAGGPQQTAFWLFGRETVQRLEAMKPQTPRLLRSRGFEQSGYYLLQAGEAGTPAAVSVVVDCAELGFGPLAAHGHADALSLIVRVAGEDVLVDPGTYDYFTYPEWRRYLRGTAAHNTVAIDGADQSIIGGPFMWSSRAQARCTLWRPSTSGGVFEGEHDGYRRLADPVTHRRRVELDASARMLTITDQIEARGDHRVEAFFHFAESCTVTADGGELAIATPSSRMRLTAESSLALALLPRSERPDGGWVSRGYHRKSPAAVAVVRGTVQGNATIVTRLRY